MRKRFPLQTECGGGLKTAAVKISPLKHRINISEDEYEYEVDRR